MQNIKYHLLNIISVTAFSLFTALTINQIISYNLSPAPGADSSRIPRTGKRNIVKSFEDYTPILESKFFKVAGAPTGEDAGMSSATLSDLSLLGTITGPASIARALIQKRGEKNPKIFALYRVSSEINNDVYGYKLIRIRNSKVYLKQNDQQIVLDMYEKNNTSQRKGPSNSSGTNQVIKKNISKAELQQKMSKNWDNALKGLTARPYRVNGVIKGYRLVRIRPYNLLYKLGVRSGDIIQRINSHPITSTQKLLEVWGSLKNESSIKVDIKRRNATVTYDFNITE